MKVLLLITAILFVQLSMGTDNNFCKHTPLPKIKLNSFTVSDCGNAPGQIFEVKVSSVKTPICLKGDFHISGQHPGRFSIVYKAAISGKIMGFLPYALDIPLCKNPDGAKSCLQTVDCNEVKELLGDPNAKVENHACILKTGDIKFFIMANMKGPLQVPSAVAAGISNTKVSTQVDATDIHLPNNYVKIACIGQDMGIKIKS
ncbi:unnamed protein product [Pocillopora meandrina]|uniref:MD-2-related lipid-recognition domain-containing protein n=1 Tax=Pocillopora meandrina TaxID=46732 RepID=A0AAU9VX50_9CNID|nr:unnamed protein product [Pocillopora meandrina]